MVSALQCGLEERLRVDANADYLRHMTVALICPAFIGAIEKLWAALSPGIKLHL